MCPSLDHHVHVKPLCFWLLYLQCEPLFCCFRASYGAHTWDAMLLHGFSSVRGCGWCMYGVSVVINERQLGLCLYWRGIVAATGHAWLPQSAGLGERLIALAERQPGPYSISLHLPFTDTGTCCVRALRHGLRVQEGTCW